MPIKSETTRQRLPSSLDRRRKLTPEQRAQILASAGESQRTLADRFNVSRRLIQLILDPAQREKQRQAREARGGWRQYYDKEANRQAIASTRAHRKAHASELLPPPAVGILEPPATE